MNENQPLLARAAGGPVEEDQPYIVGEKGPEVFVPERKGTVLPDLSTLVPARKSEYDEVALAGKG